MNGCEGAVEIPNDCECALESTAEEKRGSVVDGGCRRKRGTTVHRGKCVCSAAAPLSGFKAPRRRTVSGAKPASVSRETPP